MKVNKITQNIQYLPQGYNTTFWVQQEQICELPWTLHAQPNLIRTHISHKYTVPLSWVTNACSTAGKES